jgi:uncharacterized protein GlcG (DUF336 family)
VSIHLDDISPGELSPESKLTCCISIDIPRRKESDVPHSVPQNVISAEASQRVVAACQAKAEELGLSMSIAVCDPGGALKAFVRMDGCPLLPARISQQKAWTAVSFGISTSEWWNFIKDDPPLLHGIPQQQDVIIFGGGLPILDGDLLVGGLGVSGGHYNEDHEVAQAGIEALT